MAPATNIPTAARNVHRKRCCPCPNGRPSVGARCASEIEASRNSWFVVSATECAASASSAVDPLISPPASFATAMMALAAAAMRTVRRLAPAFRARRVLRRLNCRARVPLESCSPLTAPGLPARRRAAAAADPPTLAG